jgi:hypothetical protein
VSIAAYKERSRTQYLQQSRGLNHHFSWGKSLQGCLRPWLIATLKEFASPLNQSGYPLKLFRLGQEVATGRATESSFSLG